MHCNALRFRGGAVRNIKLHHTAVLQYTATHWNTLLSASWPVFDNKFHFLIHRNMYPWVHVWAELRDKKLQQGGNMCLLKRACLHIKSNHQDWWLFRFQLIGTLPTAFRPALQYMHACATLWIKRKQHTHWLSVWIECVDEMCWSSVLMKFFDRVCSSSDCTTTNVSNTCIDQLCWSSVLIEWLPRTARHVLIDWRTCSVNCLWGGYM